ncbi:terminase large subunit [Jiella marina]|uniref:terminase large subunit n=1 Tax=Jiella sp. LLJ827 TaxID=2917712 RepID=UPI002101625D|nr:terminase TerL endonuclease subunit [Jiella sp. LLJ827]MCQ0987537.1 terminase large subunit [Jiella sp. LLJ827]
MGDFSCPDWFERLQTGRPPLRDDLPIDEEEARLAVQAFERLRLPDVPGQPLLRDVAGEWATDFVRVIFGLVVMDEDRTVIVDRLARKFFQLVPKKNSKTTNGAAIMMTALLRNRRPSAEFLLVGPTQATAERAYEQAEGMIKADAWLKKRFHARDHIKTIVDVNTGAKLRIRSFDNKVMTGAKPVGVLVDEIHELGKMPQARKVMTQIEGGILANPEGFVIVITTQSDEPPAGIFKEELKLARMVREGEFADSETLPMLYEFPVAMQQDKRRPWADPANWHLVTPNLGRSITIERLLPKFREAEQAGIESLSVWASQHLNVEIGIAINADAWAGAKYWIDAADTSLTLEALIERSEVVVVGVDGGGLDDLLGLAVVGRCKVTKDWLVWNKAWAHTDVLDQRKEIVSKLKDFEAAGDLVICETPTQDVEEVADVIERIRDAGKLAEGAGVGLDPFGVSAIVDELAGRGIETSQNGGPIVSIPQGVKISGAIWGMERKLKDGTLWHAGQDLMIWCVGNAKVEQVGSAVKITKQAAGKAKIDPLAATFNAFDLMSRHPSAPIRVDNDAWIASYA